ncbi:uncharacterized protein Z520_12185 [Fonsecaea multimorphosa CBS 102226]|uniref:Uncharacterized protein n=1 Tax=Fonsecaea multimorphosa CBS 102226 TaxID=1442371 RepID=A0A0D2I457_9EURO|nr:uncharacterized protein Z520_12185 [Fonsecaea multimorphosa CBS 102226]KIX92101.1 hypothetical protein Z520_12185 [Fonsecaea multimorphosa CBS 102226]OAL17465.1 hypothetical protein AYO22_11597 [Fonsecaea multimorphosa]
MPSSSGPLTHATAAYDLEEVQFLLESDSVDVTQTEVAADRVNAMSTAIEKNYLLIVDLFLAKGIKPTGWDIISAIKRRSYALLELLLSDGYDINTYVRDDWPPPLADALFDPLLVKWLIDHGANPNARCSYDITPLSIAVREGSRHVIEMLLELGASIKYGQPLHYAVRANRENDIIELLLRKGASPNKIMFEDHLVSFLQFQCLGLGTPLHEAASQKNDALIQLLLRHGADSKIRNTLGELPHVTRLPFDAAL